MNINKLLLLKLPLEGYFILDCLYREEEELLRQYATTVQTISTKVFDNLVKDGWLETTKEKKEDPYTLKNISVTDKFKNEVMDKLNNGMTFDDVFDALRKQYPAEAGKSGRKLKGNTARCKVLYKNTIVKDGVIDIDLHEHIIKCLLLEIKTRTTKGNLDYLQMFQTWLSQKSWEVYSEDVKEVLKKGLEVTDDANTGFTEDI